MYDDKANEEISTVYLSTATVNRSKLPEEILRKGVSLTFARHKCICLRSLLLDAKRAWRHGCISIPGGVLYNFQYNPCQYLGSKILR